MTFGKTIISALKRSIEYNPSDQQPFRCLLFFDPEQEWQAIIPLIRKYWPGKVFQLGAYKPELYQGPALWIKSFANTQDGNVPIIYLPGIDYLTLYKSEAKANHNYTQSQYVAPLKEYLYTGAFFAAPQLYCWSVPAFLKDKKNGLGLHLSNSKDTEKAAISALPTLWDLKKEDLPAIIKASDLHDLQFRNMAQLLLNWLSDPEGTIENFSKNELADFKDICQNRFGFTPDTNATLRAAELLGRQQAEWKSVWAMFAQNPRKYPTLTELLKKAMPPAAGSVPQETWPQVNEQQEKKLASIIGQLSGVSIRQALDQLQKANLEHQPRTQWVWAELGLAPLACSLVIAIELIGKLETAVSGYDLETASNFYLTQGVQIDHLAGNLWAHCQEHSYASEAITKLLKSFYQPWLEKCALKFQELTGKDYSSFYQAPTLQSSTVFFVDALRYDWAIELMQILQKKGFQVTLSHHFSALPSLTPTAKPHVSPLTEKISMDSTADEFYPQLVNSGKMLNTSNFRNALAETGFKFFLQPSVPEVGLKSWYETGRIDEEGHHNGTALPARKKEILNWIAMRIVELSEKGHYDIEIVTDHGWLWLPSELPKTEQARNLSIDLWGRVALLKDGVKSSFTEAPWRWNKSTFMVYAPGISVFKNGVTYSHGGISQQECIVPRLLVKANIKAADLHIVDVKWNNLVCTIKVSQTNQDYKVDIRTNGLDAGTSVAEKLSNLKRSPATVIVKEESIGELVEVVIIASDGSVIDRHATEVPNC